MFFLPFLTLFLFSGHVTVAMLLFPACPCNTHHSSYSWFFHSFPRLKVGIIQDCQGRTLPLRCVSQATLQNSCLLISILNQYKIPRGKDLRPVCSLWVSISIPCMLIIYINGITKLLAHMKCIGWNELNVEFLGWWHGPVGKGACCHTWQPEFNHQPHGKERECWGWPLTSTCVLWHKCASPQTHNISK